MVTEKKQIVLASASPRRLEILYKFGISFIQHPVHIDESVKEGEDSKSYVVRMSQEKAEACSLKHPMEIVLAADTIVVANDRILLKPHSHHEALEMFRLLSGKWHSVLTAMTLKNEKTTTVVSESRVKFKKMSEQDMEWYIDTGEPWDKAGGYGIQGKASLFIERFDGDFDTIVGLSSRQLPELFQQTGLDFFDYTF